MCWVGRRDCLLSVTFSSLFGLPLRLSLGVLVAIVKWVLWVNPMARLHWVCLLVTVGSNGRSRRIQRLEIVWLLRRGFSTSVGHLFFVSGVHFIIVFPITILFGEQAVAAGTGTIFAIAAITGRR